MTDDSRIRLVAQPTSSPRYQPVEFTVRISSPSAGNPFEDVRCWGTFRSSSGRTREVSGFCDSDDGSVARLRFCPEEEGRYTYRLRCADRVGEAEFAGDLESEPSSLSGFVRVDPDFPRHFRYDSGGHPFLAGKTAWILGSSPLWREFLDLCVRHRQNVARFALGGLDFRAGGLRCRWWGGSDDAPDLTRYDLGQWRQIDQAIRYAAERGILVEVCFFGDTSRTHGGSFPIPHPVMERFWDYALARLAGYPNVLLWQLFNEYTGQPEYQAYMAEYLRRNDPHGHLVTTSGREVGDIPFPEADWNDLVVPHFCTGSHEDLHRFYRAWAMRLRSHGKPVYVDETGRAIADQGNFDGEHRRKQYWIWAMSGVYSNFHSKGGCYVDLTLEPGEEFWTHLVAFWRCTEWYRLEPTDDLVRALPAGVAAAYALASDDEAVVYLCCDDDRAVADGNLTLDLPVPGWWAYWYDPKTGCTVAVDWREETSSPHSLAVPAFRGDLALHLQRRVR